MLIEDDRAGNVIPLPNVNSNILAKVIEYCLKHVHAGAPVAKSDDNSASVGEDLKTWDADFVNVDQGTLFGLMMVLLPSLLTVSHDPCWFLSCVDPSAVPVPWILIRCRILVRCLAILLSDVFVC